MQAIFNLLDNNSLPLHPGLPTDYRGIILEGSEAEFTQSASGQVILQNYHRSDFAIQFGIYKFLHMVRCILRPPPFASGSLLVLKNEMKCSMKGIGSLTIKKGEFSLIQYGNTNLQVDLKACLEYQLLEITFSPEIFSSTLAYFPGLTDQLQKTGAGPSPTVLSNPRLASENALGLVHDLLNSPFNASLNEIYFEYKIREYLLLLLVAYLKVDSHEVHLTTDERRHLTKLGLRMQQHPGEKFPISSLAKELGMNESKLKLSFKKLFGKSIQKYRTDERMKEAYRLLKESGLPTKEIAKIVGFDLTTSFITRFREYFGYPPSHIQNKF